MLEAQAVDVEHAVQALHVRFRQMVLLPQDLKQSVDVAAAVKDQAVFASKLAPSAALASGRRDS